MSRTKNIITLFFSLMFLLGATISYAESLNDWEKGVFLDIVERWHEMVYGRDTNWSFSKEEFARIYQEVANKYNISVDEVRNIDVKGYNAEPILRDTNYTIYCELGRRLKTASTIDQARRAHTDIANQYGISLSRLYELEYIDMWFWQGDD